MTQTSIPHIDLTPLLEGADGDDPAHADSVAAIVDAVTEAFRGPASEPPRDDAKWYSV